MIHRYNQENWEKQVLQSERPVLVDVILPWKMAFLIQSPSLQKLSLEWNDIVKTGFADASKVLDLTAENNIKELPALALFHRGIMEKCFFGASRVEEMSLHLSSKFILRTAAEQKYKIS